MSIYTDFQELAEALLAEAEFGQSTDAHPINILVRSDAPGATDLDEPTVTWAATRVDAVSRGVSAKRDGEALLQKADIVVLVRAKGVAKPSIQDRIEIAGEEYSIVSVESVPNAEAVSIYRIFCKR